MVYELNKAGARRRGLPEESGRVTRLLARRSDKERAVTGIRVVRVPGGFAYVEERS